MTRRVRKGTRMLRYSHARVAHIAGVPGHAAAPLTDPERIPHQEATTHVCGWCGGTVSHNNRAMNRSRLLCHSCMRAEFGGPDSYDAFIRSERARQRERAKRISRAGHR